MDTYRCVLEVIKWASPSDALQHLSTVSTHWNHLSNTEELWITFGDSVDLDLSPPALSHKQRFRLYRKPLSVAVISARKLCVYTPMRNTWEVLPLSSKIEIDESSSWAAVSKAGFVCCGGGADGICGKSAYLLSRTGTVQPLPSLYHARGYHGLIAYAGVCYAFGGMKHSAEDDCSLASVEKIDVGKLELWQAVSPMLSPRHIFTPCEHRGRIYLLGGQTMECEVFFPVAEDYHPLPLALAPGYTSAIYHRTDFLIFCCDSLIVWDGQSTRAKKRHIDCYCTWGNSSPIIFGNAYFLPQKSQELTVLKIDFVDLTFSRIAGNK